MTKSISLLLLWVFLAIGGCAETRVVTIGTRPADAIIRVDGIERGRGPITQQFVFKSDADEHRVTASRLGYKETMVTLTRDDPRKELMIDLKPQTRDIHILVSPVPALVNIDGKRISDEPVSAISRTLEFTVDSKNNWTTHTVTAERPHFQTASQVVSWTDRDPSYTLNLAPMKKNLNITTNPPGATVLIDQQRLGISPLKDVPVEFPADPDTNDYLPRKLTAEKPGYDPVSIDISWDNGKPDYNVDLTAKTKEVRIVTNPPNATVKIDDHDVARDANGQAVTTLQFPPIDDEGNLRTYTATITRKTADEQFEPQTLKIGWDNGQSEYRVALKEILTRPVSLLSAVMRRSDDGWHIEPEWTNTLGMKDTAEPDKHAKPKQLTQLPKGSQIGSLALSPDGSQLLFTVLSGTKREDFRSQMLVIRTDGTGGEDIVSDGRSLDLMPSYSPGGDQVVFSSDRNGRLDIWSMSASGAPGVVRLATTERCDLLWPCLDSDPKPRLFCQAMVDRRTDPRIYISQLGTVFQTDLLSGMQPRVSPTNDTILYAATNAKTQKRDIYRVSDRGMSVQNLTNTPDADDFDANWSKDGSRIVFTSDRGVDQDGRHNYDIWMIDVNNPQQPIQITTNGSQDDCPVFDVSGEAIYFRSNRGGSWQIWKLPLK